MAKKYKMQPSQILKSINNFSEHCSSMVQLSLKLHTYMYNEKKEYVTVSVHNVHWIFSMIGFSMCVKLFTMCRFFNLTER